MSLPRPVRAPSRLLIGVLCAFLFSPSVAAAGPLGTPVEECGEPQNDNLWWNGFAGNLVDGNVRATVIFEGRLVLGGDFGSAGGVFGTETIAVWNGQQWEALGSPPGGIIRALAVFNGELIAGGSHMNLPGVSGVSALARWDGATWKSLGYEAPGSTVNALAVLGGQLIVGGDFTEPFANLAAWDGETWTALGSGVNGGVASLAVDGSVLYAGGAFTQAGAVAAQYIAIWNGTDWSTLGDGVNSNVYSILVDEGDIYVGGGFSQAGSLPAAHIALWDGAWHALGDGVNAEVLALAIYQGKLHAGGRFYSPGSTPPSFIAAWDGTDWSGLGSGPTCNVFTLAEFESSLIVGGCFSTAGGKNAPHVASWNGSDWDATLSNHGNGLSWYAGAFLPYEGQLAVGGGFSYAGSTQADHVALWNGTTWTGIGGMNGNVRALALFDGDLIAAGRFTMIDGAAINNIARWNGASWLPLGDGIDPLRGVTALRVHEGDLIVAGDFLTAGGKPAAGIARWDGAAWHDLGGSMSDGDNVPSVHALGEFDGKLVAGGRFVMAGTTPASAIAAWDGTTWTALGSGMTAADNLEEPYDPWVEALEIFDGKLVAAGDFTAAGGVSARFVAAWDGSAWSPLGAGLETQVYALTVFEERLIAGGPFLTTGTPCMSRIANWDGAGWSPLGTGMNGFVLALGVWEEQLYAGGSFTRAGSNTSMGIARWNTFESIPVILSRFSAERVHSGARIQWEVTEATDHAGFHVYRETAGQARVQVTEQLLSGSTSYELVDSNPPRESAYYWLLEVSRSGATDWFGPVELAAAEPLAFRLAAAHPNPFRESVRIDYVIPLNTTIRLSVFDVQGREVATLAEENRTAGAHTSIWNGRDAAGRPAPQGLYFIKLESGGNAAGLRVLKVR